VSVVVAVAGGGVSDHGHGHVGVVVGELALVDVGGVVVVADSAVMVMVVVVVVIVACGSVGAGVLVVLVVLVVVTGKRVVVGVVAVLGVMVAADGVGGVRGWLRRPRRCVAVRASTRQCKPLRRSGDSLLAVQLGNLLGNVEWRDGVRKFRGVCEERARAVRNFATVLPTRV
jgi:hypothetical protein